MFRKIEDHLQKNILISDRVAKASTKLIYQAEYSPFKTLHHEDD